MRRRCLEPLSGDRRRAVRTGMSDWQTTNASSRFCRPSAHSLVLALLGRSQTFVFTRVAESLQPSLCQPGCSGPGNLLRRVLSPHTFCRWADLGPQEADAVPLLVPALPRLTVARAVPRTRPS